MTIKVEDVFELISSQDFANWYNDQATPRKIRQHNYYLNDWPFINDSGRVRIETSYEKKNTCLNWLSKTG